jgi:3-isopropylmalate/(R)-2-methylmalate dehydratase small subunit
MIIKGNVWKYGDDVNTDLIFPGRFTYILMSEQEMADHALEDLDPAFGKGAQPGDIIVAGKNWGCGSSREQAVKAVKAKGIAAIIGKSFARIYFRNSLNEGLPVIVCPQAVDVLRSGKTVSIDFENNKVITPKGEFTFGKYPDYIQNMVDKGGLLPFVKDQLKKQGKL